MSKHQQRHQQSELSSLTRLSRADRRMAMKGRGEGGAGVLIRTEHRGGVMKGQTDMVKNATCSIQTGVQGCDEGKWVLR